MKKLILLLPILLFSIFSCTKKEEIPSSSDTPIDQFNPRLVNFSNLKPEQKTIFERYITHCDSIDERFNFTGDKLTLEVIDKDGELFLKETLTEDSPLFTEGQIIEPIEYPIFQKGDYILLPERTESLLFYFYGNDTLTLAPDQNSLVDLRQSDCRLMIGEESFIGIEIGNAPTFEIGEVIVQDKTAVSCVPLAGVDAYLFYDKNELHLSHAIQRAEFPGGNRGFYGDISGWRKVDE